MYLQKLIKEVFSDLENALQQIGDKEYVLPISNLFGATMGQHVRHIIELYQCLIEGYDTGEVDYEKRRRDIRIETGKDFAIELLHYIATAIYKDDKAIKLEAAFGSNDETIYIETNYNRELLYNLEHTIHHMALIKVGLHELGNISLPESFGVAPSTMQYKRACVQ